MKSKSIRELAATIRGMDQFPMFEDYYTMTGLLKGQFRLERLQICCFHSEHTPSMHFHKGRNGIFFKCFGCGESGDIFKFVIKLHGLDFAGAVNDISTKFCNYMITVGGIPPKPQKLLQRSKEVTAIAFEEKPFTDRALEWWSRCGLEREDLIDGHLIQCNRVTVTNLRNHYQIFDKPHDPLFVYLYSSGHVKVYRPLTPIKASKWRGNVDQHDLYGSWWVQPSGNPNIICSGPRDAMTIRKHTGFTTVAPISENTMLTMEQYITLLLHNFSAPVFILYDNDVAGKKYTKAMINSYPLIVDLLPAFRHCLGDCIVNDIKDASQLYEIIHVGETEDHLTRELKSYIDEINKSVISTVQGPAGVISSRQDDLPAAADSSGLL